MHGGTETSASLGSRAMLLLVTAEAAAFYMTACQEQYG
jgi:hypothetical protein